MAFLNRRIDPMPFLPSKKKKKKSTFLCAVERKKNRSFREGTKGRFSASVYILSRNQRDTRGKQGDVRSKEKLIDIGIHPREGKRICFGSGNRSSFEIYLSERLSSVPSNAFCAFIELVHYSFRLIPRDRF